MPRLEEDNAVWRYTVQDTGKFDKLKVKDIGIPSVKITVGRIKGTNRWEIQNYLFAKAGFKSQEHVRNWLDAHLKGQIQTLLDFKAWNEWRRRCVNAYVQISSVE